MVYVFSIILLKFSVIFKVTLIKTEVNFLQSLKNWCNVLQLCEFNTNWIIKHYFLLFAGFATILFCFNVFCICKQSRKISIQCFDFWNPKNQLPVTAITYFSSIQISGECFENNTNNIARSNECSYHNHALGNENIFH